MRSALLSDSATGTQNTKLPSETSGAPAGSATPEPSDQHQSARQQTLDFLSEDWYWEQDEHFRFTLISGAVVAKLDLDTGHLIGATLWAGSAVPVSDANWDTHRAVLADQQPFTGLIYQSADKQGAVHFVQTSGMPAFDAGGKFTGYRGIAREVTSNINMQRRLTIEHAVAGILAANADFPETARQILRSVCQTLGWVCGARWQFDPGTGSLHCAETWGVAVPEVSAFLETSRQRVLIKNPAGLSRRALSEGKSVWIRDLDDSNTFTRADAARAAGLHTALAFPLMSVNESFGVMEFFSREIHAPTQELLDCATYVGQQIGAHMVHKRTLHLSQLEHAITRALAAAANANAGLEAVLSTACQMLGWDCGLYFQQNETASELHYQTGWGGDDPRIQRQLEGFRQLRFAPGSGLIGKVWASGKPLWSADLQNDNRVTSPAAALALASGMGSAFTFPVKAGGKTIGVLTFACRRAFVLDERQSEAAASICSQIGQFLQRKQAEHEQLRFRAALDTSSEMMMLIDPIKLRYMDVGGAACRALGYSRKELLARGPTDVTRIPRDDFLRRYASIIAGDPLATYFTGDYIRKDGSTFPFEAFPRVLHTEDGPLIVAMARDISERRAAEAQLHESADRYAEAIAAAGQYVWEMDPQFCYTYLSDGVEKIRGHRKEELLGRHIADFFAGVGAARARAWVEENFPQQKPVQGLDSQEAAGDGSTIWLRSSGAPVFDGSGALIGYRGTSQNVTAEKEREQRAELVQAAARVLARNESPDAAVRGVLQLAGEEMDWACASFWILNPDSQSLRCRQAWSIDDAAVAAFLAGWRRQIIQPGPASALGRVAGGGAPQRAVRISSEADYRDHPAAARAGLESSITVPLMIDNQVLGALQFHSRSPAAASADRLVTVQRIGAQIAQSIVRHRADAYAKELERSNANLQQFAYVASHDLQEPLRMITSYTQLMLRRLEGKLDEDTREFAGFVTNGAARMKNLIQDLLAYSRLGSRPAQFVQADCGVVLDSVLANLRTAIESSGAVVTRDALPMITADESQLRQLLQNLVGNALKFCGKNAPQVHVGAELRDTVWVLSVKDKGIGIKPEHFEHIFVMFQRLHGGGEYAGTGIGLAICQKVIEQHGGHIQVESRPGQGCTFYCSFPLQQAGFA